MFLWTFFFGFDVVCVRPVLALFNRKVSFFFLLWKKY
uniref:Uncharacterized protein n=1 Tax=Rhizophora mucronata TaxID=61149 RepID=A0A2P2LGM8_RHIMU